MEMDITILLTIISGLIIILLFSLLYFKSKGEKKQPQGRPQGVPVPRRAVGARNARARLRAAVGRQDHEFEDDEEDDARPQRLTEDLEIDGKIGAKKRAKLEAKAERKAQREVQEREREEKKKKQEKLEEERKRAEEKELAEEQKRLEEERKAREEKARRDHEEYLKLKEAFTVEEEGFEEIQDDQEENLLQQFIRHIKENKVVILEDLAAHFKLKTQSVIDRITTLQNDGVLTGVIDDRGKFIYISQEELEAVAKFVKQCGRVSLTELVENSNRLIDITPAVTA
ncbi:DDRGK domain containing 1 [Lycorma delicatula]|uniref:DDRGK domain containing 1 n=1 Tax=Lycorma delicatula TaxID=130591 RepID=UPI003F51749C